MLARFERCLSYVFGVQRRIFGPVCLRTTHQRRLIYSAMSGLPVYVCRAVAFYAASGAARRIGYERFRCKPFVDPQCAQAVRVFVAVGTGWFAYRFVE